jgi:MerR family transcriptional regulator, thiopeptide resistance regulator
MDTYRVREFAELAGVTVKALHHYDRLGLLKPARSGSGYRVYATSDLARLEQIVALRFLGIPLKRMGALLDLDALPLATTFRRQRESLEDKRRLLDLGIEAMAEAERTAASGAEPATSILGKVIRIIAMQDIDVMRKYFSDEAWAAGREHFGDWPSEEWQALYRDVAASIDADPASPAARALADRWLALALAPEGAGMRTGLHRAWADREHWPPVLKRKLAEFNIERATRFIKEVLWIRWDAERESLAHTTTSAPPRVGEHRRTLYRDCAAILGESPAGPSAQAILARWRAIVEEEAGGDDQTRAQMLKAFRGRATWPAGLKRYWASLYDMDAATWERVADFIDRANNVSGPSSPSGPRSPSGSSEHPPTASSAHPQ